MAARLAEARRVWLWELRNQFPAWDIGRDTSGYWCAHRRGGVHEGAGGERRRFALREPDPRLLRIHLRAEEDAAARGSAP